MEVEIHVVVGPPADLAGLPHEARVDGPQALVEAPEVFLPVKPLHVVPDLLLAHVGRVADDDVEAGVFVFKDFYKGEVPDEGDGLIRTESLFGG